MAAAGISAVAELPATGDSRIACHPEVVSESVFASTCHPELVSGSVCAEMLN